MGFVNEDMRPDTLLHESCNVSSPNCQTCVMTMELVGHRIVLDDNEYAI